MGTTLHTTSSIINYSLNTVLQSACQVKKTNKLSFKETKKKTFASLHMHCTAESKKNTEKS